MTDSVNQNAVSLCSYDFEFPMNPNGTKKDRYIGIFSYVPEFLAKGMFSTNQVYDAGHFYENKPCKLGCKQRLFNTEVRESRMLISDGLA